MAKVMWRTGKAAVKVIIPIVVLGLILYSVQPRMAAEAEQDPPDPQAQADLAQAEVKGHYCAGSLFHCLMFTIPGQAPGSQACPASPEIKFISIPNRAAAAPSRWSAGVEKMMSLLAGRVSQLFSASSCSSCPAAQPA